MDLKNKTISGVKWTSFSSIVIAITQTIQLLVLSRFLDAHDFGLWAIINLIIFYSSIFSDLGISAAVIHFQSTTQKQLSTLYWVNIVSGISLFFIIWAIAPLILSLFDQAGQVVLLLTAAISLPLSASGILFKNLFQKEMHFNFLSKVEVSSVIIGVTVTVLLAINNYGVWSFVFGQLTNISIKSLLFTIRGWRNYKIRLYFNLKEVKQYLKFGSFQIGEKSINLLNQRLDQVLIGTLIGTEALGYYNFAFKIISKPIALLNPIFTRVSFPLFAKLQNEKSILQRTYLKLIKFIATINAPIYALVFVTAPIAIPIIFGEKWHDSIILIQVLSAVSFFRSVANPVGSLSLAMGRPDLGFKWNVALFILSTPIIYFAGMVGGSFGIAIGLLSLQIILFYPNYKYLVKPFIGEVFNQYFINIVKPMIIASLMFATYFIRYNFLSINQITVLATQILASGILYLTVSYMLDKKLFKEIFKMVRNT